MSTQYVIVVLFDDVQSLDVTGPMEVLTGANDWCSARRGTQPYEVRTAGVDAAPVRTSCGLQFTPDIGLSDADAADMIVVPGGQGTRASQPQLVDWLAGCARNANRLVSVCTGAYLLAEAGLLTGRRVATHWAYCEDLAGRYPEIDVRSEPIFVEDGAVVTSAGVTAGIDLMLALVETDIGRQAALDIARHLVVFLRRPGGQAQFSTQLSTQMARRRPLREVQQWIEERPAADLSIPALAHRANLSTRQFTRAFTTEVGMTPGRYVDSVRIQTARRSLEDSALGIVEVARACGYGTAEAMRRAFLRSVGVSPAEYRARFHSIDNQVTEEEHVHSDRPV